MNIAARDGQVLMYPASSPPSLFPPDSWADGAACRALVTDARGGVEASVTPDRPLSLS